MRQDLKNKAKQKISGKLLFLFLILATPAAISSIFVFVFPLAFLASIMITFGVHNVYLKVANNQNSNFQDIFISFNSVDLQRYLVTGLYYIMWVGLYSLLLIVPGIIKAYEYSQIFFIANEKPNLTPKEVLAESKKMMDGRKMELLSLHLSFIGWFILSGLTFGLAGVYVLPYFQMTTTAYYLQISKTHGI